MGISSHNLRRNQSVSVGHREDASSDCSERGTLDDNGRAGSHNASRSGEMAEVVFSLVRLLVDVESRCRISCIYWSSASEQTAEKTEFCGLEISCFLPACYIDVDGNHPFDSPPGVETSIRMTMINRCALLGGLGISPVGFIIKYLLHGYYKHTVQFLH